MGYWEQIAVSNRKNAARRAAMHPLRRKLGDAAVSGMFCGLGGVLWLIMLSPLWRLVFN